jgi:hypothetical protein
MSNDTRQDLMVQARLSFPSLYKMTAYEGSAPAYASLIVVEDKAIQKQIVEAVKAVATAEFGAKEAATIVKKMASKGQFKDAEYLEAKGLPEGSLTFNAKNKKRQPGVVGRTADPKTGKAIQITEEMATEANGAYEMYGGVVCNVALAVYPYRHKTGGNGVAFGLTAVQRWDEGERFGGAITSTEDLFDFDTPEDVDLGDVLAEDEDDPIADIL